ncbi:MAG: imidazolonepropionase [[Clostridium] fimetarium]|nr:imidazolonepropionase [Alistipes timonensis]MCM1406163.1 imidazolonepropionase [[Clostridium] fimetarium]
MRTLIKNISSILGARTAPLGGALAGADMALLPSVDDAWLAIDGERIEAFGPMESAPSEDSFQRVIDARRGMVIPAFCDSHTHIVWAGSREGEFRDKIAGLSYAEIAAHGGGILNSADRLNATPEDELFAQSLHRLRLAASRGTGAIEIKTGYGLTLEGELKMLRVIRRLREAIPSVEVKATFLGAHAVGRAFAGRQGEYVDHLINDMLPAVAAEGGCDFVDVFCDEGFFTTDETARILDAAARFGLVGKIHANELAVSGGVQVAVSRDALSADHLERITEVEIEAFRGSRTIPTMLPGASFFLGMPYGPARMAIEAGLPVALASDWNPGSSPSGDMRFVWTLACAKMKLTPEEALNAMTVNTAAALGLAADGWGSITPGGPASLIITKPLPSLAYIPYAYTEPWIEQVILKGS